MNQVIYDLEIIEQGRIIERTLASRRLFHANQRMSARISHSFINTMFRDYDEDRIAMELASAESTMDEAGEMIIEVAQQIPYPTNEQQTSGSSSSSRVLQTDTTAPTVPMAQASSSSSGNVSHVDNTAPPTQPTFRRIFEG